MYKLLCLVAVSCVLCMPVEGVKAETRLTYDIQTLLEDHPEVNHERVVVNDQRWGRVELRGYVQSERQKKIVEELTRDMPGVQRVDNQIRVERQVVEERARLRAAEAFSALELDDQAIESELDRILPDRIRASVSNGQVVLEGDTSIHGDVDRFLADALNVRGVTDIENRITLNGSPYMQVWRETNPESQRASRGKS